MLAGGRGLFTEPSSRLARARLREPGPCFCCCWQAGLWGLPGSKVRELGGCRWSTGCWAHVGSVAAVLWLAVGAGGLVLGLCGACLGSAVCVRHWPYAVAPNAALMSARCPAPGWKLQQVLRCCVKVWASKVEHFPQPCALEMQQWGPRDSDKSLLLWRRVSPPGMRSGSARQASRGADVGCLGLSGLAG